MSDRVKKGATHGGAGIQESAAKAGLAKDPRTAALLRAGGALGNDEMKRRMDAKNANRDQMLAYIVSRLGVMREAQKREMVATQEVEIRKVWQKLSDEQKPGWTYPDPTRWKHAALTYEEAAYHLSRGDLARGKELIQDAMKEEKKAFDELTPMVDKHDLDVEEGAPAAMGDVTPGESAAPCDIPVGIDIAADIYNVTTQIDDINNRRRTRDPTWFEDEEEEEEEGKGKGEGAKS